MSTNLTRRNFMEIGSAATIGLTAGARKLAMAQSSTEPDPNRVIRFGIIGVGRRGSGLLKNLLSMPNLAFPAICDIDKMRLQDAQNVVVKAGHPKPDGYCESETAFERMTARDDLDAVLIATPWNWHTPMAVSSMKGKKYTAVEVPCAITKDECRQLVNTSEQTGMPCMMLENWSFRRDNLAVLKMIRDGLFGDIVHCHCAHSHECIENTFFESETGNDRWPAQFLVKRNCDQYPTHSLGPVLSWMNINCGDRFDYLTSTATNQFGITAMFNRKFPDHPNAKREFMQGDIVTTVVRTVKGKTIVINYDMQLPRPYDNRWMIQGIKGIYNEQRESVYLLDKNPQHHQWEPFAPYQDQYDHTFWTSSSEDITSRGHGGVDYIELREFIKAVRNKIQTPIDVYDSVTMSCIIWLSEESISKGSVPVKCPDYTKGRWETKQPTFATEA